MASLNPAGALPHVPSGVFFGGHFLIASIRPALFVAQVLKIFLKTRM
jgi:hypothetical protein